MSKKKSTFQCKFFFEETRTILRPYYVYPVSRTTTQYTLLVTLHNMKENNETHQSGLEAIDSNAVA